MTSIEAVFEQVTGVLQRSQLSAAWFAELSDDESERTHTAISAFVREVTKYAALSAANIAQRSDYALGGAGLARSKGFRSPEEFVQHLGGGGAGTKTDARRLIDAGMMATEAETARRRQAHAETVAAEHPELPPVLVEVPWFAALGDAVTQSILGTEAAALIRRGLGEPAPGVTEDMLRDALALLIDECRTLNADQASRAARYARDRIDAAGIASRAEAMRERQYLRTYTKADGMLHGDFELDPVNGAFFTEFLLQVTGPRIGGPRFVEKGEKARAQAIIDDPRSTGRIAAESLIEAIKVAAGADPGVIFTRSPGLKVVVQEGGSQEGGPAEEGGQDSAGRSTNGLVLMGTGFVEGSTAPAPAAVIQTMICNTGFTPILFGRDAQALDVGREVRLFTAAQRAALAIRDGGCMMPGCLKPPSWSEAHHINRWHDNGGLTNLEDGILLCAPCHLRLHNDHWDIVRNGTVYWLVPPATADVTRTPIRLESKSPLKLRSPIRFAG